MNWDVMNDLAGFPAGVAMLVGFGIVMLVGWRLTKGTGRHD